MIATEQTADTLQDKLRSLTTQRQELATDAELSRRELETARNTLVEGKGDAEAVTAAQSRYNALEAALSDLDGRVAQLTAERDQARAGEENRERVSQAAAAATEFAAAQKLLASQWEKLTADIQKQHAGLFETAQKLNTAARKAHAALSLVDAREVGQVAPDLATTGSSGRTVLDVIAAEGNRESVLRLVRIAIRKPDHTHPVEQKIYDELLANIEQRLKAR